MLFLKGVMSKLPVDEILRLYNAEKLNVRQIADRLGLAYGQVYGVLRKRVVLRKAYNTGPRKVPSYLDVAEAMRQRIIAGNWKPDSKIPPRNDLARAFHVNHQVIRDAADRLREQGYLTVSNRGTFVRPEQYWIQYGPDK